MNAIHQRVVLALAISLVLPGCASITTGQNQPLSLETVPCRGAICKLTNDKGTWFVNGTPGTVTVQRAYGDMIVICEKDDFKSNPTVVSSTTKGMAFGNILAGGIIGAAIDAGTGAAYDYPAVISVPMICVGDPKTVVQPLPPPPSSAQPVQSPASPAQPAPPAPSAAQPVGYPTPSASAPPTPPTKTAPAAGIASESKYLIEAERIAKLNGCVAPVAAMNFKGEGSELFTVACSTGVPLSIRCDAGACRVMN